MDPEKTGTTGTTDPTEDPPEDPQAGVEPSTEQGVAPALPAWALTSPWGIREEALQAVLDSIGTIRAEHFSPHGGQRTSEAHDYYKVQGNVAVLHIRGAIVNARLSPWLCRYAGLTSMPYVEAALMCALDDPTVQSVMLAIDSPGGQVSGLSDLAEQVHNSDKPVYAHVIHQCTSAAYKLAAACNRITTSSGSIVGGLGVVMTIRDYKMQGERMLRVVSSQTPAKDTMAALEKGKRGAKARKDLQEMVDQMATETLAAIKRYGRDLGDGDPGKVYVGEKAVEAGLADELMTFSEAMEKVVAKQRGATRMNEDDLKAARAEAVKAERERTAAIMALPGTSEEAQQVKTEAVAEGLSAGDCAIKLLDLKPAKPAGAQAAIDARAENETGTDHPSSGTQGEGAGDEAAQMKAAAKAAVEANAAMGNVFLGRSEGIAGASEIAN